MKSQQSHLNELKLKLKPIGSEIGDTVLNIIRDQNALDTEKDENHENEESEVLDTNIPETNEVQGGSEMNQNAKSSNDLAENELR